MSTEVSVSVLVPFYEAQDDLDLLTHALARQTFPAGATELIVADDGSPTPPRLSEAPFPARVVSQEDRGFRASAARDLGARAATGDLLVFLDGDMIPEPGFLTSLVAAVAEGADVVVGRRRHLDPARLPRDWVPGDVPPPAAVLPEPAWLADGYRATANLARMDATGYRFVISALLAVDADLYRAAGGFDPRFVGYGGEDWELAHRLWRAGGTFRHAQEAVAWHRGPDVVGRQEHVGSGTTSTATAEKNTEMLRLAPLITAPTARGTRLALGVVPRVAVRVEAFGHDPAAVVLCVDAVLGAAPASRVTLDVGRVPQADREVLSMLAGDPRVVLQGAGHHDPHAPRSSPTASALREIPDWQIDVHVPVRPLQGAHHVRAPRGPAPGSPDSLSELLLAAERAGYERIAVHLADGTRAASATSVRALAPRRGGGPGVPVEVTRVALHATGWEPVQQPDLEAWWGGWS